MRLIELSPSWVSLGGNHRQTGFILRCPDCLDTWLIFKAIEAKGSEQEAIFSGLGIDNYVLAPQAHIWRWEGDFVNLTLKPPIEPNKSGHWRGRMENGVVLL